MVSAWVRRPRRRPPRRPRRLRFASVGASVVASPASASPASVSRVAGSSSASSAAAPPSTTANGTSSRTASSRLRVCRRRRRFLPSSPAFSPSASRVARVTCSTSISSPDGPRVRSMRKSGVTSVSSALMITLSACLASIVVRATRFWFRMYGATCAGTDTCNSPVRRRTPSSSIARSTRSAVDSVERTTPVPLQVGQVWVCASTRLGRSR